MNSSNNPNFQGFQPTNQPPPPIQVDCASSTSFSSPYMRDSVQSNFNSVPFQQHNSSQHPFPTQHSPYNNPKSPYHQHQHPHSLPQYPQQHPQTQQRLVANQHFSMPSSTDSHTTSNGGHNLPVHSSAIQTSYYSQPMHHLASPHYEGNSPYPSTSMGHSPTVGNPQLVVPQPTIHMRKTSKGKPENICEMITSMLTDEESSREQMDSRKSTIDYSGYSCDNIDAITPTLMANSAAYGWNGGATSTTAEGHSSNLLSSDYYRRKESLPSFIRHNSMLSPPSYQCERSRSMSTVCAPNFYVQQNNHNQHNDNGNNTSLHCLQPTHSSNSITPNNHTSSTSSANPLASSSSSGNLSLFNEQPFAVSNIFDNTTTIAPNNNNVTVGSSNRRSKSTVVAAMPLPSCTSLHRFNSLLRKVSYVPSAAGASLVSGSTSLTNAGLMPNISPFNPLLSFTPYTPPPILSPMRNGTGLFFQVARNPALEHKLSCRNITNADQLSFLLSQSGVKNQRMVLVDDANKLSPLAAFPATMPAKPAKDSTEEEEAHEQECSMTTFSSASNEHRIGRTVEEGKSGQDANNENSPKKRRKTHKHSIASGSRHHHKRSHHCKMVDRGQEGASKGEGKEHGKKFSQDFDEDELADKFDTNTAPTPQRKNGLFLSRTAQSASGCIFAAELEALRKESGGSSVSNLSAICYKNSVPESPVTYHARMNMRNKLSVANEDIIRKMSSVSMDENKERKESCISDYAGEDAAPETDAIPHINLGKNFQARVKKWADREITVQERAAIPDRDEAVFDAKVVDHLPQACIAAYETLACSVAVPKPGRNKELALHILMENQGNIQSAVMDLLRSDTLDWEQYPLVFNNLYVDVDQWVPEEISSFQDAIYKSEKDFHQVATELGSRTVKECVAFYYTWKKACPDDYRKLRNLRRKRQLLEQQLDFSSYASRIRSQSDLMDTSEEEFSGTESDITNPSYGLHNMDCSPETRAEKLARVNQTKSPVTLERKNSTIRFNVPATLDLPMTSPLGLGTSFNNNNNNNVCGNSNSVGYPWLHGEMFPSPSSSTTSNTHESGIVNYGASTMAANSSSGLSDLFDMAGVEPSVLGQGSGFHSHKVRGNMPKKGAQPAADGFFHCRLCEKRFEKVKSLNAHMKSHAMKARAEAEAQAQQQISSNHNRFPKGENNSNTSSNNNNDLHMHDSPEEEINLSPLNLCQPSSAAVAAAALGLNNLNRLAAAQHSAAKMQGLLNTRDLVSAAMTHLAATSGASQVTMGMTAAQQQQFNTVQSMQTGGLGNHGLGNSQQIAAMAAAAAAAASQQSQTSLQQQQQMEAVAAATSLSTLQQLHSNLQQQQQQNLPNFQAQQQQQQQYPTTIIH